jgi:hypothetical protein
MTFAESGFVGNVWIAQHYMPKTGMEIDMHEHDHDHASLLVSGSVDVNIEGQPIKRFTAPTFIVIRANMKHKIVAVEDNTIWYCVFALRDIDGNIINQFDESNAPYIDPIFNGTQCSYQYKILYADQIKENRELKQKILTLEEELNRLKLLLNTQYFSTDRIKFISE